MSEAFDVQFGALLNVLTDDLGQALPRHDVVPLGLLLPFVASIFVLLVGREAEFGNWRSAWRIFHLGIFADISDEDNFVHALRHIATPIIKGFVPNCECS
jgi:hypothetical protein